MIGNPRTALFLHGEQVFVPDAWQLGRERTGIGYGGRRGNAKRTRMNVGAQGVQV